MPCAQPSVGAQVTSMQVASTQRPFWQPEPWRQGPVSQERGRQVARRQMPSSQASQPWHWRSVQRSDVAQSPSAMQPPTGCTGVHEAAASSARTRETRIGRRRVYEVRAPLSPRRELNWSGGVTLGYAEVRPGMKTTLFAISEVGLEGSTEEPGPGIELDADAVEVHAGRVRA